MKGIFCCWKAWTLGRWDLFNHGACPSFFLWLVGWVGSSFLTRLRRFLLLLRILAIHFLQAFEKRLHHQRDGERWRRRSYHCAPYCSPIATSPMTGENHSPSCATTATPSPIMASPIQTTMPWNASGTLPGKWVIHGCEMSIYLSHSSFHGKDGVVSFNPVAEHVFNQIA